MDKAKFWVSLLGAVLVAIVPVMPGDYRDAGGWAQVIIAAGTAATVYLVPNKEKNTGRHVKEVDRRDE